ncbi:5' nucleotidase, NT5C type (plasmid) [Pseudarthrobacter sp. P1]|uniref:5' nucleotidase, NT5C type n=1 Tax=Pseudarthrobacter sp. P1 TaxID=3418418 RepID=UPI003CEAD4CC
MTTMTNQNTAPGTGSPIVLVDMDGVFVNWGQGLNDRLLARDPRYPIVPVGQQLDYDHLCGPGGDRTVLAEVMDSEGLYLNLEPLPGAVDAILAMEEAGLDVFFCSTPFPTNPTCASEKLASIERHLGLRWVSRTILTHDKTLVRGDVLIDDHPGIIGAMKPAWRQLVFDQSYNRNLVDAPRMTGWKHWEKAIFPMLEMAGV